MATSSPTADVNIRKLGRNRALCCECGSVRSVARQYNGKKPEGAEEINRIDKPWCNWLKCSHCARITLHAEIQDFNKSQGYLDGGRCIMEDKNREVDAANRSLRRLLTALRAEGVEVEWCSKSRLVNEEAPVAVELRRNGPSAHYVLTLCDGAGRVALFRTVQRAVYAMDNWQMIFRPGVARLSLRSARA